MPCGDNSDELQKAMIGLVGFPVLGRSVCHVGILGFMLVIKFIDISLGKLNVSF